jgi:hypothetical protein
MFEHTSSGYSADHQNFTAWFNHVDTDSALIFISNVAEEASPLTNDENTEFSASFHYQKRLKVGDSLKIVQLIGSCQSVDEKKIASEYSAQWQQSMLKNRERINGYALRGSAIMTADSTLNQTAVWSKAVLESNIHYLNNEYVPMPCPAEYNFFFTHDALLTNLGAVYFDIARVKKDLLYLKSLTRADSILPHAYYWKDGRFVTEFCGSDNWNHFWFIILANSYFKHSGDLETIRSIFPVIEKSMNLVMKNKKDDDLLYGTQPDWWDIGNVFGARSYISLLMIKALQEYAALCLVLNKPEPVLAALELSDRMNERLAEKLWDEDKAYFMNMLDTARVDNHFYAGSIIAAAFNLVNYERSIKLLETARNELLDKNLGIRNVMPADFHKLIDIYKFQGMEAGEPYVYANGGVWPQGTIWYCLGLIETNQIKSAKEVLKRYLTIEGIKNSPNGQPSFYEYRNADANSLAYGTIDKPTFTWAGGWYLHTLYKLLGIRETPWNIYFSPSVPQYESPVTFDLFIMGKMCKITYLGNGRFFNSIEYDNEPVQSAVIISPGKEIVLECGIPIKPYLSKASCGVNGVDFNEEDRTLNIMLRGISGQVASIEIISPEASKYCFIEEKKTSKYEIQKLDSDIYRINLEMEFAQNETKISVVF